MLTIWLYWDNPNTKPSLLKIFEKLILHNNPNLDIKILDADTVKDYVKLYPKYYDKLKPAHQADYIRVKLLYDYGGLWLDSDILVMNNLKEYLDIIKRNGLLLITETYNTFVNCMIGAMPKHPYIRLWLQQMNHEIKNKKGIIDWVAIGSKLMMNIFKNTDLGNNAIIIPAERTFYNIPWQECNSILLNTPSDQFKKYYYEGQNLLITVNSLYNELKYYSIADIFNMKHTILYQYLLKALHGTNPWELFKEDEFYNINDSIKYGELINNLPPIYYINLDNDEGRKHRLENTFKKLGIKNYYRVSGHDARIDNSFYIKSDVNEFKDDERPGEYGCTCSHLKAIREFYKNSKANAAIICEDDLDITAYLEYWDYSFMHMLRDLPWDYECCMLCFSRPIQFGISVKMQPYESGRHFSTVCYMITREGAKTILDKIKYKNGVYNFTGIKRPAADYYIYENLKKVYAIPLFSYKCDDSTIHSDHVESHRYHRQNMTDAWRKYKKLD